MDRFIQCMVNADYSQLIIEGNPTDQELLQAWEGIYEEYTTISDLPGHSYGNDLIREIAVLYHKLAIIEWNVLALRKGYYPECIEALHKIGVNEKFDPKNSAQYIKDLYSAQKKAKGIRLLYDMKEKEYQEYKENNKGNPITEMSFMESLASLSAVVGHHLSASHITVFEYCAYIKLARHGKN